ncbi:MAG: branched-chain amino acid ABC transporter permease [Thermoleophilia bacterium]
MAEISREQSALTPPTGLSEFWVFRALRGGLLTAIPFTVLMALLYLTGSVRTQQVVLIFITYLMVVLGLQVFTGNSGVISFAHVAFMAIGGYTAALMSLSPSTKATQIGGAPSFILNAHYSFFVSTLIAIAVTCAVAAPFGFVFARLSGTAAAIATLAFYFIVYTVIANWTSVTHGTFTLYGIESYSGNTLLWWGLAWSAVGIIVARLFRESGIGLSLRATSSDDLVARAVGVDLTRARLSAWVLSAGLAAVGGALYMKFLGSLAPTTFSFDPIVIVILVLVIVGGRSVSGVVVGATLVAVIDEILKRFESHIDRSGVEIVGLATIFTLTMVFRSSGLFGRWEIDELFARGRRRSKQGPRGPEAAVVEEGGV